MPNETTLLSTGRFMIPIHIKMFGKMDLHVIFDIDVNCFMGYNKLPAI